MRPDSRKTQLAAFAKVMLPPLLARYRIPLSRVILAIPAVRMLGLAALWLVLTCLVVPAGFIGLMVWLATNDLQTAIITGAVIALMVAGGFAALWIWLRGKWRRFRRRMK